MSYIRTMVYDFFFFFKQKTAYEMRISDWSSDVCSSDLDLRLGVQPRAIEDSIQFDLAGEDHDFEAIISSRKRWNEPDEVTDGSTDWVIDWKLDRKSVV